MSLSKKHRPAESDSIEFELYDTNFIYLKTLYSVRIPVDSNFIQYDQDQQHLLPKNVAEWVEEDSLERYISDVVDRATRRSSRSFRRLTAFAHRSRGSSDDDSRRRCSCSRISFIHFPPVSHSASLWWFPRQLNLA